LANPDVPAPVHFNFSDDEGEPNEGKQEMETETSQQPPQFDFDISQSMYIFSWKFTKIRTIELPGLPKPAEKEDSKKKKRGITKIEKHFLQELHKLSVLTLIGYHWNTHKAIITDESLQVFFVSLIFIRPSFCHWFLNISAHKLKKIVPRSKKKMYQIYVLGLDQNFPLIPKPKR
jgi:hypothetical protein